MLATLAQHLRRHIYRVHGTSMAPWVLPGDYLMLGRFLPRHATSGRVIVVAHAGLGIIVKRILDVAADGKLRLAGDAATSTAPEAIGMVHREQVIGRVLLRIRSRRNGRTCDHAAYPAAVCADPNR